jgi:hypothetical protein
MSIEPQFKSNPVEHDLGDLVALSRLAQPGRMRMFRIAAGAIVAMVVLTIWLESTIIPDGVDWPAMALALFASFVLVLLSTPRVRGWLWLKVSRRGPLYSAYSYGLYPTALLIGSAKGKSEIPFTSFVDLKRAEGRMFFFMSKRQAYIVPSRAFDSDADFEAFAAAAEQRWETRHRL